MTASNLSRRSARLRPARSVAALLVSAFVAACDSAPAPRDVASDQRNTVADASDAGSDAITDAGADTSDVAPSDVTPDAPRDAAPDGTPCPADAGALIPVNGTVYSNDDGSRIAGALVSVEGLCPPPSATTPMDGSFRLMLPVGATIFLRAATPTTVPFLRGFEVPAAGTIQDYYIVRRTSFDAMATALGYTIDPTKGYVWVSFEGASVGGYGATLSAAHGAALTRAPGSDTDVVLSDTSLVGDLDHWFVLFPNTAVGTTTITLHTPAGHTCTPRQPLTNWLVRPDAVMYYEADCD